MAEMSQLAVDHYAMLEDDWKVEGTSFESPLVKDRPGQTLLFGARLRNGSVSADITLLESHTRQASGEPAMEAALVVRYGAADSYFYAGTGAFHAKLFIGKVNPGPLWQSRAWVGQHAALLKNKKYRLRVEFSGSQIALYENDVQQLVVIDETYQIGQCGLAAWKTHARFDNVQVCKARPRAFVIMPFKSELDFVHEVIEQTVDSHGIDCVRADQIAISRPVMEDVKTQIAEADLVIVDFTGKNPNVYYEAGLADAWQKDWIVLTQTTDDLTFDVRHIRSIQYSNTMGADKKLKADLENALKALQYKPEGEAGGSTAAEATRTAGTSADDSSSPRSRQTKPKGRGRKSVSP
jgi:hypothetical protein